jgi:hypothetical protein
VEKQEVTLAAFVPLHRLLSEPFSRLFVKAALAKAKQPLERLCAVAVLLSRFAINHALSLI